MFFFPPEVKTIIGIPVDGFCSNFVMELDSEPGLLQDPNAIGRYHRSPLWRAAYAGNEELIRMLLRSGGDPRECDEQGHGALTV